MPDRHYNVSDRMQGWNGDSTMLPYVVGHAAKTVLWQRDGRGPSHDEFSNRQSQPAALCRPVA